METVERRPRPAQTDDVPGGRTPAARTEPGRHVAAGGRRPRRRDGVGRAAGGERDGAVQPHHPDEKARRHEGAGDDRPRTEPRDRHRPGFAAGYRDDVAASLVAVHTATCRRGSVQGVHEPVEGRDGQPAKPAVERVPRHHHADDGATSPATQDLYSRTARLRQPRSSAVDLPGAIRGRGELYLFYRREFCA